jgi:hypothetical protein
MSLGDIRGIALGVLGMSLPDFYAMPVGVFWEALGAHQKEVEAERRHMGELVRGAALRLFNINLKRKDQIRDPRKFWEMPWDEPSEEEEQVKALEKMTDEQRAASARSLLQKIGW